MTPFHRARRQTFTPLLTPFSECRIDVRAFEVAIDRQIVAGVDGVVVGDPIGEGPSLSQDERDELLKACIAGGSQHLTVIAATGTNCTAETIERCRRAEDLGADGLLVTVPYYSKPMLKGVLNHFHEVAAAVSIPVIVDDDPCRTARDYGSALLEAIASLDIIIGICHGTDRLSHFAGLSALMKDRFLHLSRDDRAILQFLDMGGHGAISPLANVIPSPVQTLIAMSERSSASNSLERAVDAAAIALGRDEVVAVKEAQSFIHQSLADVRLPLVAAEPETVIRVRQAFAPFARCGLSMRRVA